MRIPLESVQIREIRGYKDLIEEGITVFGPIKIFRKNPEAMRHDAFRSKGMFTGSGTIEAGARA